MVADKQLELKVFIACIEKDGSRNRYHMVLEHPDGKREMSHQHWPTIQEAEQAIKQYAKDREAVIHRAQ